MRGQIGEQASGSNSGDALVEREGVVAGVNHERSLEVDQPERRP